jgi:hypothetical protein
MYARPASLKLFETSRSLGRAALDVAAALDEAAVA